MNLLHTHTFDIIMILFFILVGTSWMGLLTMIDVENSPLPAVSRRVPIVLFSISGLILAAMLGICVWMNTGMTYELHDVEVCIYYMDGTNETKRFNGLSIDEPRMNCMSRIPWFTAGSISIPNVCRFVIVNERRYEMTGRELRRQERRTL